VPTADRLLPVAGRLGGCGASWSSKPGSCCRERRPSPWSLSRLAGEVASSPYHLTRVFHAATGTPIHRYLRELRLAVALERLTGGGGRLTAIALAAGFGSHNHFATAFRRAFGVPPIAVARFHVADVT